MNLDVFAIRKNVDVKRLKHQLWEKVEIKLDKKLPQEKEICMTGLMEQMYYGNEKANEKAICDPTHVSVHSAFICMLHLANEKGISFQPGTDENFEVDF
jgi:hypothetical protein